MSKKIAAGKVAETDVYGLCSRIADTLLQIQNYYTAVPISEQKRSRMCDEALSMLYGVGEEILKESKKQLKKLVKAAK